MRELHAHGGRQPIPHGAKPARGHPAVWLFEAVELRSPHLVLAHLRGDVGVAGLSQLIEALDRILRLDYVARLVVRERLARAPFSDLLPPGIQRLLLRMLCAGAPYAQHILEHVRTIPD